MKIRVVPFDSAATYYVVQWRGDGWFSRWQNVTRAWTGSSDDVSQMDRGHPLLFSDFAAASKRGVELAQPGALESFSAEQDSLFAAEARAKRERIASRWRVFEA